MKYSLVHIVMRPIVRWHVVPLADTAAREKIHDVTVVETRNEVGPANNVCGVEESKRALLIART